MQHWYPGPKQNVQLLVPEVASLTGGHRNIRKCESVEDLLSNDMKWFFPQSLFQRCEKLRPLLFRLASETVDDDEALGNSWCCPWNPLHLCYHLSSFPKWSTPFLEGMLTHVLPKISAWNDKLCLGSGTKLLLPRGAINFHLEPTVK